MNSKQLAKKALKHIHDMEFTAYVFASVVGTLPGGWEDDVELELSRAELLYLIHQQVKHDSFFEGMKEEEVDVNSHLSELAYEGAWDSCEPTAVVADSIPYELEDIAKELETIDVNDIESVEEIIDKLRNISAGTYTFCFTVEIYDFELEQGAKEGIKLSANEALGLLYGKYNIPEVFSSFDVVPLDEEFVNQKAEDANFASKYDYHSYGGYSDKLDNYLEAWTCILNMIYDEEIDEESLDSWLEYFDDSENFECSITDWHD